MIALLIRSEYMGTYATWIASQDIQDEDLEVLVANNHTVTTTIYSID